MIISIHDKLTKRLAFIDNEKPDVLHFKNDTFTRILGGGSDTFDFEVSKTGHRDERLLTVENYVSFLYNGNAYLFHIVRTEETEESILCYTESMNLELLNEISYAYDAPSAMTFEQYFNNGRIVGDYQYSGIIIGINEVSEYSRKLSWEGSDNKLNRLLSLANKFDAEIELFTYLDADGKFNHIEMNVYKKHSSDHHGVGMDKKGMILNYGKDIKSIRRTVDIVDIISAIRPYGRDGMTIESHADYTEYDENNDLLYYFIAGRDVIYAPQTAERFPSNLVPEADKWIAEAWDYDTESLEMLFGQALARLKKKSVPDVSYEIEGDLGLNIGDTCVIRDTLFDPVLLINARVSEQRISFSDPEKSRNYFINT